LKITSPGVPDIYRGTELWDFSVADPDNRRPVDFALRNDALGKLQNGFQLNNLVENWSDGRLKMYVMWRLLNFRREHSDLFQQGEYIPLRITGASADHVVAFARRLHDKWFVVAVPRLHASLGQAGALPLGKAVWQETEIEIPRGAPVTWKHILTGHSVSPPVLASGIFHDLPLATLST
jgi:(1->4)-alpha-D-glucan 1-alpha-D-glucosylmutase